MDTTVDLDQFSALIARPEEEYRLAAEERWGALERPRGGLGDLERLGSWLAAVQGRVPTRPVERARLMVFAGDHGVAALGVSALRPGDTARRVRATLEGGTPAAVLARRFGASVRVADLSVDADEDELPGAVARLKVRRGSERIDRADAITEAEAAQAFLAGVRLADEEADAGTDLVVLGDLGVGSTTVASALIGALCGVDAASVTGRGSGIDDRTWMVKCATVRDAMRRARPLLGEPLRLLAASAGADYAAMTGFLLQCAVRRTPVLLDGVVSAACALVAQRIAFRSAEWWRAGQGTGEPAQAKAFERLGLEPLLEQRVSAGGGGGALMALPLLTAASALLAELPPAAVDGAGGSSVDGTDAGSDAT